MTRATADATCVKTTKEGALIPGRNSGDWADQERALAARRNRYDPGGDEVPVSGKWAETNDGRRWEVAPSTVRCNTDTQVLIRPPYADEWVECEPLHFAIGWRPRNGVRLFAVDGLRDGYPMVAVMRRLTTGAGDFGHRAVYVGPYFGKRRLLPVSMDD